jgi:hypothetical protein
MTEKTPFASNTLTEHLLRGVVGGGALIWAINIAQAHPLASLGLGVLTLVALRGCPTCWTIGLVETASRTIAGWRGARD